MQPWGALWKEGSYCLFCALRRPPIQSTVRSFATTPVLRRSKAKMKKALAHKRSEKPSPAPRSFTKNKPSQDFSPVVYSALQRVKESVLAESGGSHDNLAGWDRFERYVMNACKLDGHKASMRGGALWEMKASLEQAYFRFGAVGLEDELRYILYADSITSAHSLPNLEEQEKVTDLRFPAEWYPQARSIQRTIYLHVGPTNSGKTYRALKRLEASKKGFYAGPLRLLAQEVYHRFKTQGVPCSLVTGDDVKVSEGTDRPRITSNTVEMISIGEHFDVGVIDEVQMIADPWRGWSWTRAVLGSRATELHLCGEPRIVPLIRKFAALTGDKLEIHRYERLNPLRAMDTSLKGDLRKLQKGDCLVSFSRVGIHALKGEIEKMTGRRAAIVYGGLPAEIRTQQASLFNDPDNDYDFLVASDAIGMGLNLSCKRIIFETLVKRLPGELVRISIPEIKQIGGRAGRYRTAAQAQETGKQSEENVGLVTSLEDIDLPYIQEALKIDPPPISAAGIFPPDSAIKKFAAYFPREVPFEYIIKRVLDVAKVHPLFFMCDPRSQVENAQLVDTIDGLRIDEKLTLMAAPLYTRDKTYWRTTCAFARCIAEHTDGRLLGIPELKLEVLEKPVSGEKEYLNDLETLHKSVILYSWLSYRFGGVFTDRTLASHVKELVEERMIRALTEFSANKKLRRDSSLRRQFALQVQMHQQYKVLSQSDIGAAQADFSSGGSNEAAVPVPEQ